MAGIEIGTYNVINTDDISSARVQDGSNTLIINMKNGQEHWVRDRIYGKSVWDLYREITKALG